MLKSFISSLIMGICFSNASDFQSSIFSVDEHTSSYLHTYIKGEGWHATNATNADQPFIESIFMDQDLMQWFGAGPSPHAQDAYDRTLKLWLPRFEDGYPHGGLIIRQDQTNLSMGFIMGGYTPTPGAAGIAYVITPDFQGRGLGTSVLRHFITQWAPEVARIGKGEGLPKDHPLISKFNCFNGKFLERLFAFVSPDNDASLKLLEKNEFFYSFCESPPILDLRPIFLQGDEDSKSLENIITIQLALLSFLESENKYTLVDKEGKIKTFALPGHHGRIKYQLERPV